MRRWWLLTLYLLGRYRSQPDALATGADLFSKTKRAGGRRCPVVFGLFAMSVSFSVAPAAVLPAGWGSVAFGRCPSGSGWLLVGVPPVAFGPVCARLFLLGCSVRASGSVLGSRRLWVSFAASAGVAAQLALLFPCLPGRLPLVLSGSGSWVLSGAAERGALARLSSGVVAGVVFQRGFSASLLLV